MRPDGGFARGFRMRTIALPWTTVYANSTTVRVEPATGWMRASDFAKMRGTLEVRALLGDLEVAIGYQTANVETSPDTAVALTAYETTDDVHFAAGWTSVQSAMEGKQIVRLVFMVKCGTSNLYLARVSGAVDVITD